MGPVGRDLAGDETRYVFVDVPALRVIRDDPVVLLAGVELLDHVMAHAPLPDDLGVVRVDLDNAVVPEVTIRGHRLRIAALFYGLLCRDALPGNRKDVAIRQDREIVVRGVVVGREIELPYQVTVLVVLFQATRVATGVGESIGIPVALNDPVPVRQYLGQHRQMVVLEDRHDLPIVIDQEAVLLGKRLYQRVTGCDPFGVRLHHRPVGTQ